MRGGASFSLISSSVCQYFTRLLFTNKRGIAPQNYTKLMKKHILPLALSAFIPLSASASSVFVFDTSDAGILNASDFRFSNATGGVSSVTGEAFLLNSLGGRTATGDYSANLNPNGFAVGATFTVSNVVTSVPGAAWSMTFRGIGASGTNNSSNHPSYGSSTFGLQNISGGILSFDFQVDYLNNSGNPAGFAAAPDLAGAGTPIFDITSRSGSTGGITASVSTLDAAGNTIPTDYLGENFNAITSVGGVVTGSITAANGNRFNVQAFDDGDSDNSNDLFSSVFVSISGTGGTILDDNSFTISLDSQMVAFDGVVIPEPTGLTLLSLGMLGFLTRRKRA